MSYLDFALNLNLTRPIIFVDTETTGPNPREDRIVEIGFIQVKPDGSTREWQSFVDPLMPIPREAIFGNKEKGFDGHGITDDMVKGKPTFRDLAPSLPTSNPLGRLRGVLPQAAHRRTPSARRRARIGRDCDSPTTGIHRTTSYVGTTARSAVSSRPKRHRPRWPDRVERRVGRHELR